MEKMNKDLLVFTTGIDRISVKDQKKVRHESDPVPGPVLPSEELPAHYLDLVIKRPSLETRLVEFLKPDITKKEILVPSRYRTLMEDVYTHLATAAERTPAADKTRVFIKAARLMETELENMDLLNYYRNVLLQA